MLEINNQYTLMKRRIDTEVLRALYAGNLGETVDTMAIGIIPRDRAPNRCCIYKERAMVRYRIMALLGVDIDRYDDEYKPLKAYVQEAMETDAPALPVLTTISSGCSSCPDEQYRITDSCRGCFARPCLANCPKDAIEFVNGRARIIEERCVKCGKCMEVCPFHAVVHVPVPCEQACPVDAVKKNAEGFVEIDHEACISCGHCARSCPFGAIVERSALIPVVKMLMEGQPVTALVAPAIEGQFPGSLEQIHTALLLAGFSTVMEVAQGAAVTADHEAHELISRMKDHKGFMTTSCCPAWMELVDKHLPAMKSRVSSAMSPMAYAAKHDADKRPENKRVFIGPCLAKKIEASRLGEIDAVITFSELAALLIAKDIDVRELAPTPMGNDAAYKDCRGFASSQGVAHAVLGRLDDSVEPVVFPVDGIDRKTVRSMRIWEKRPVDADLVEVMCCEGGCLAGPGVVVNPKVALRLRQGTNAAKAGSVPLRGKP